MRDDDLMGSLPNLYRKSSVAANVLVFTFTLGSTIGVSLPSRASELSKSPGPLLVHVDEHSGKYVLSYRGRDVLNSGVGVEIDAKWLLSTQYPRHSVTEYRENTPIGPAHVWQVSSTGLRDRPDLIYRIKLLNDSTSVLLEVETRNSTPQILYVQAIRSMDADGLDLGGSEEADRVLSDSFSEDRPAVAIHNLGDAPKNTHMAVGSQLVYNRESGLSFFLGALTSDRLLTFMNINVKREEQRAHIQSYTVEATGTTDLQRTNSLAHAAPEDIVQLKLPLEPGTALHSEAIVIGVSNDYHAQLEQYGTWIKHLHHARVSAPSCMGWWSWTAYYFGLNEGAAWTNAQWLSEHLKHYGYHFFHIDEGYQFARGEYTTPNATLFPHGMVALERKVSGEGLVPGLWTAPFEVSERSWVYQQHPGWLVANAKGTPLQIGFVSGQNDRLYALDTTNPEAQEYLRRTYSTLKNAWGIRYIKLDFMDDTAVEGYYHKPNTTAIEAQRIGLEIIRAAVGDDVLLDKDGSPMLNPVGIVDTGRISQDTGHTFSSTREAATGVAARYYMNRTFFVSDPDAFSVSRQFLKEQVWHGGVAPLTLNEGKASIALAAVAGGMFEIGDDLPRLTDEPDRLALIENEDLINMARMGRSSIPLDLMNYNAADEQPSVFYLKETPRQSILTVFNWTDKTRDHAITLSSLGLIGGAYTVTNVFSHKVLPSATSSNLSIHLAAHSVVMLKIHSSDTSPPPTVQVVAPSEVHTGSEVVMSVSAPRADAGIIGYTWDFGDGVETSGTVITHTFCSPGHYKVKVTAHGVEGVDGHAELFVQASGSINTLFTPSENHRYPGPE